MIITKAIIQQGRVETQDPIELPDGTEVSLTITEPATEANSDEAWDNSPEGIADWIRWSYTLQPLLMTPEEEADTADWLRKMDKYSAEQLKTQPNVFE
jgi:hypothetical protein